MSKHMVARGIPTMKPNEVTTGGTDFAIDTDVAKLKALMVD